MKTIKEILTEARTIIADMEHWTQHTLAADSCGLSRSPDDPCATCWCADGALQKVIGPDSANSGSSAEAIYLDARVTLAKATMNIWPDIRDEEYHCCYVAINDGEYGLDGIDAGITDLSLAAHTNIIKAFDAAIASAGA
jgi:hypothetical protein